MYIIGLGADISVVKMTITSFYKSSHTIKSNGQISIETYMCCYNYVPVHEYLMD